MNAPMRLSLYPAAIAALAGAAAASAGGNRHAEEEEIPFEEARLFFELNHTDGDLGIHALVDGDEWKRLELEDPHERKILDVQVLGRLRRQGLTEIFFESAEPSFDELSPEQFFRRFPEGEYEFEGRTLGGEELEGTAELSHVMPGPPGNVQVAGIAAAENCDAQLPVVDGDEPVVVSWAPVTTSHPEVGEPGPVEVANYQFVVEVEAPDLLVMSVDLPPGITQFEVPAALIDLADEFKFEIVVRADSGNQTVVESCFEVD